jgi:two-component system nitrogen regulation sensor histidine kinase GlnL
MAVERLFETFAAHHDPSDLLDALLTGIVLLDADFRIIHANVSAQGLLAVGLNQSRGRPLTDLFVDGQVLAAALARARDRGEVVNECEVSLRPVSAPREARIVDAIVSPVDDVTGSRRFLLELSDAAPRARLSRDNELRTRLEGNRLMTRQLAHEIKNPLGGLRGSAQLLARQLPDADLREYTTVIINEADRLTALVDSMTSPARPTQKAVVNVHEICEHIYRLLRAESGGGVRIERDYDPSIPEGFFDRNQLVQAVGERGTVTLRTRAITQAHIGLVRHRLAARIDVLDDGPGVPPAIRSSLFFPLVTGRANGTGLGLALSQELVNRNGGIIEYESEPGRTVFSVLLPLETEATS